MDRPEFYRILLPGATQEWQPFANGKQGLAIHLAGETWQPDIDPREKVRDGL